MINIIIITIIVLAIFFAVRTSIRHFMGQGSCCGGNSGGSCVLEKKLDGTVVFKKNVKIQGMICEKCEARVQNALNEINGASAKVNLKKAEAKLDAIREVSEEEIRSAVQNAGNFNVVSIEDR
ncbi:MAG: heavy metal-associated domain-containing protein [Hallerella succinigenes]|uniref:heavy-metal-associated domain-containing protein n=1 Tax=Hallerella succinigenes TaxID=1896222 RepID=UPI0023F56927|nr:heavy metal-associated domain-containing protein [Hallerella succinigenes]MDD6092583.1 heavy metal-associated domain-containing protein [Hallerella succinigenes]